MQATRNTVASVVLAFSLAACGTTCNVATQKFDLGKNAEPCAPLPMLAASDVQDEAHYLQWSKRFIEVHQDCAAKHAGTLDTLKKGGLITP